MEAIVLKQKIGGTTIAAICVAIGGLILIYQPDFLFSSLHETGHNITKPSETTVSPSNYGIGLGIMSLGGISISIGVITRRSIGSTSTMLISFYFSAFACILSLIPMLIFESITAPSSVESYIYVVSHIFVSLINTLTFLEALRYTHGYMVAIIFTSSIPMMLACQYTVLREIHPGHENAVEIVGAALVSVAAVFLPLIKVIGCQVKKEEE